MSSASVPLNESAAGRPLLRTETLAGSVMVLLAMTILQRGIGFVRGVLFCRWLSPAELGQWDMAFGFLMMAAPIAVLGVSGSFGRYLEYYRHRGHVRTFLRGTCVCILISSCAAAGLVIALREQFSELVFGRPDQSELVALSAVSLLVIVAYNVLSELFGGLRMFRFASAMQFFHSLVFAALGMVLVLAWRPDVTSVLWAFLAAYLVCAVGAVPWLRRTWRELPLESAGDRLSQASLWKKIAPFAAAVWITNWLFNLFEIADRWMLLHFSGLDNAEAMAELGNYHSARVLPLPLLAVASLLSAAMLPHISHDWECGRRREVSQRVNSMLKLTALLLVGGAICLQAVAPWIFHVALEGRLNGGLTIFPLTLACFVWTGLISLACCYLWCAEKAVWGCIALFCGLVLNCGMNLFLVPRYGLFGAVLATAVAKLVVLTLLLAFSQRQGLYVARATWIAAFAPLCLCFGLAVAVSVYLALLHQAITREWLLTADERQRFGDAWRKYTARLRRNGAARNAVN